MKSRKMKWQQPKPKRKVTVPPEVAFHEAGHALARYLVADMMGIPTDEALNSIVIHRPTTTPLLSFDGTHSLEAQATTYGAVFSADISAVWQEMMPAREMTGQEAFEAKKAVIAEAHKRGADIESWLRARAIIAVAGAVAEAMAKRISFDEVWNGYEAEHDMSGLVGDVLAAGLDPEDIESHVEPAMKWFVEALTTPGNCAALNALARKLGKPGNTPGRIAIRIIERAKGQSA